MNDTFAISGIYATFDTLLTFHQKSYDLQYKVTLLVLKLLSETYFQCSFCDKLQLKEKAFFYFWKPGLVDPAIVLTWQKYKDSSPGFTT